MNESFALVSLGVKFKTKNIRSFILVTVGSFSAVFALGASSSVPKGRQTFSYQIDGSIKDYGKKFTFVDLFDVSTSTISSLKSKGRFVVCYFSAGTYENWRSDASSFSSSVKGKNVDGWSGEKWLDIRKSSVLTVMKKRLDSAKSKGCNGVDPDNLDAYEDNGSKTGFSISKTNSKNYILSLATEARSRGLAIGLKNCPELASSLASSLDWVVVEECHKYSECSSYSSFKSKNKPIFQIEYTSYSSSKCSSAKSSGAYLLFSDYDLDGNFSFCPN